MTSKPLTDRELKEIANDDPTPEPNRVSVLYGDYGKRKTVTACSMVRERGLLLNSDGSWKVLLNSRHAELNPITGTRIKAIELDGLRQFEYIDFTGFDTIIWDPVSSAVARYQDLVLDESNWGGKYRDKITSSHPEIKNAEIKAPVDYLLTRDHFRPIYEKLFKLDAHIIFTSHATKPIQGLSKKDQVEPRISAATFEPLGQRADLIVNLRYEGRGFIADMSENSSSYLCKSRIEGLEGKMPLDTFVQKYKELVF